MSLLTCLLLTLWLFTITATATATDNSPTVYELMESYDLPAGLLPKGVSRYELDPTTGKFAVYLNKTCSFSIDGYDLKYKTRISGTIKKDKVSNLKGIQVKILFFWVNIVELSKDKDELDFSVGIASASFPVDGFYESPQCGCGFDCLNNIGKKESLDIV